MMDEVCRDDRDSDQRMYELGQKWFDLCDDDADDYRRFSETNLSFAATLNKERFHSNDGQSNDGEPVSSVWQDMANCRTAETAADYRQTPNSIADRALGCSPRHTEKPGTPHFEPTIQSPVHLDLIIEASSLVHDVDRVESAKKAEESAFLPPWANRQEFQGRLFEEQGHAFYDMKRMISQHSPQEVSTLLTLANDSLKGRGAKFVFNNEGYVDLQTKDGRIYSLNKLNHNVLLDLPLR